MTGSVHFSSERQDWLTPEEILRYVREFGVIALDPCHGEGSVVGAARTYTKAEDGLLQRWANRDEGLTWLNPPYGREVRSWVQKAFNEYWHHDAEVVGLVAARPDTEWFQNYCMPPSTTAVCWWRGRLTFQGAAAPAPFPSAVVYWGLRKYRFAEVFSKRGRVWVP